ncbi:MAG: acylphosphatase [Candidatus Portnoybacteria bacterium]|nr:acylphosphatase [Candidatus Portnoybacteria bacterium]MDD4982762.1 acylphosphatase [Candidatus Portnoybacteria bacterium]
MNTPQDKKEIECIITGRVQLVMFRDFATRRGRRLHLAGTVQNLPDGSVLVVAQGTEDKLAKFIELLKKGPILSEVEKVQVAWREPGAALADFKILN